MSKGHRSDPTFLNYWGYTCAFIAHVALNSFSFYIIDITFADLKLSIATLRWVNI